MKFSDLFVPKIARSNPQTRIEAIKEEENVQLLKKVLDNDSDENVRDAARKRLEELGAEETA
jgi:hypothetical protein